MNTFSNKYLRHTLATIAYRFQKSVSRSDSEFGQFNLGHGSRNTVEIINHICHLLIATRNFIQEDGSNEESPDNLNLETEIERVNYELRKLDNVLKEKKLESSLLKQLLQGPLADILTHIGQISMMSRLNGSPISGEDFSSATITAGKLSYF